MALARPFRNDQKQTRQGVRVRGLLLVVLCILSGLAYAKPEAVNPSAKASLQDVGSQVSQKPEADVRRGTDASPVYVRLIDPEKAAIDWTAISVVLSAIGTIVAALSAWAARKAANAAEHSVRVSRDAYVASERAWVSVEAMLGSDLVERPHGIEFGINFTVKNHGNSPAVNVHVFYEVVTLKITADQFDGVRKKIEDVAIQAKAGANMGVHLFPGAEKVIPWINAVTFEEIDKAKQSHKPPAGKLPSVYVVGSVFYQFPFDDTIHQTGFNYYVTCTSDPSFPKGSDIPEFSGVFPKDHVRLEPMPYYKGTIN